MRAVLQVEEAEHGDAGRRGVGRVVAPQADAFVGQVAPRGRQVGRLGAAGSEEMRAARSANCACIEGAIHRRPSGCRVAAGPHRRPPNS